MITFSLRQTYLVFSTVSWDVKAGYYIDTDEIPGEKIISSSRAVKIAFLSFACGDIGVAMVTNMISQLQESFPLRLLSIIVFISPF